jgi:selenium metabolism protein YedF
MTKHIDLDCRGLACPGPVLKTMEAIEKDAPATLTVTVDDQAALENVSRLLTGKGYTLTVQARPGGMVISATRNDAPAPADESCAAAVSQALTSDKITVFITADSLGQGSDELGGKLMLNFLATLPEIGPGLWRVVLVNGGVRLACEGSPCLEKLQALATGGVSVLVCGTCLGFFGLTEQKRVGETTNMLDVVTSLGLAGKVIQV